ncbi:MAG TPA: bifunctional glutamate N-acetyltransferase/amino-acid acetyltransferase ArgJ, partial [Gaiellaceae bacterium]|nr:bifunctional glutamate N-acetyltransferase/amino-acid acetyltransferase ArgJ [Gaiellaceae bacterium]
TRARRDRGPAADRSARMSVTAALGFVASGVHAHIRKEKRDLAIVRSVPVATGAAMWTQNRVLAAPVVVSKRHLESTEPQAIVINSGIANAATGAQGEADAIATAEHAAGLLGLAPEQVLVLSTGVIGAPLPMDRMLAGVDAAAAALSPHGGDEAAEAILTTDTHAKTAVSHGFGFTVGGMAKGSGMIHPNLATMLAVLTTDYPLEPGEAIELLRPAVDVSFNSITVDGDCSTNDAVILLSSGAAAIQRTPETDEAFVLALGSVCSDLSHQIVVDGEGATLVAEINVSGAVNAAEARAIAQRIATSPLVKTALFGHDANWGRVLMAAGSAPFNGGYAHVDPDLVSLSYNGTAVLVAGTPQHVEPNVDGAVCTIDLDLGLGDGSAGYLTSDLSYDYVRINAEYRS